MISYKELRKALAKHLKTHFPDIEVHFDTVEKANKPYFYIELREKKNTYTEITYERLIDIVIMLVYPEIRVKRAKVYEAIDKLNESFGAVFQIEDRFLTLQEIRSFLVDDILHYEFSLSFADSLKGSNEYEYMQELHLKEV